jgi:hypothetical protein
MKISARDLAVGNIILVNDWQLHVIRIDRDAGTAVLTEEFGFLIHLAHDDVVTVQARPTVA